MYLKISTSFLQLNVSCIWVITPCSSLVLALHTHTHSPLLTSCLHHTQYGPDLIQSLQEWMTVFEHTSLENTTDNIGGNKCANKCIRQSYSSFNWWNSWLSQIQIKVTATVRFCINVPPCPFNRRKTWRNSHLSISWRKYTGEFAYNLSNLDNINVYPSKLGDVH